MFMIENIQKKRKKGIYNLIIDDGRYIEIADEVLFKLGYGVGDILEEKALNEIRNETEYFLAKQSALKYLRRQERSFYEIERYLQKSFNNEAVEKVLSFIKEYELADDTSFVKNFIQKSIARGAGNLKIKYELKQKGIEEALIDDYIFQYDAEEDSYDRAYKMAKKKMRHEEKSEKSYSKIGRYLASKGYENDTIYKVLNKLF